MDAFERAMLMAEEVSSDETWTRLEKYETMEYFSESDVEINLDERTIGDVSGNVSTIGEDNSQYIQFIMDRYADGVDLTTMLIQVQYRLENGQESVSGPVNAYASESRIRFGWPISRIATQREQTIQFIVFCTGNRQDGEPYVLKTKPIKYKIEFTLGIGGTIIAPDEDWFLQFENVMNEKMNQVASLTSSAIDSAAGAKESEQNAAQSASTASTLAGQVQSNTAQAKASADAAKVSEQNAKNSEDAARVYAGNASAVANVQIGTSETAGLLRGGDIYVDESGALKMITQTTETTLSNSHEGRLLVEEIGGVTEQDSTTGKNLLDCRGLIETEKNGITFTPVYENGMLQYIEVNGTATARADFTINERTNVTDKNVIFSGISGGSAITYSMFLAMVGNETTYNSIYNTEKEVTFADDIIYYVVKIRVVEGQTVSNLKFYPMIRKSDITDATYEPFTNGPAPNPSYPMEIKKSVVKGVRTHKKNFWNSTLGTKSFVYLVPIKKGQSFTISYDYSGEEGTSRYGLYIFNEIGGWGTSDIGGSHFLQSTSLQYANSTRNVLSITAEYDGYLYFRQVTPANNVNISNIQVEEGTVATPYEPYTSSEYTFSQPIDLYGMNDVQDVTMEKPIKRRFSKRIFDGSEGWSTSTTLTGRYLVANLGCKSSGRVLCTQAKSGEPYHTTTINECYLSGNSNGQLVINTEFATLAEWKAHLSEKPMEVVYELAEEATEELPIADQIGLNSLLTYDGVTYVEFIYDELEPTFKGKYGTSEVGGYTLEALLTARNAELKSTAAQAVE